MKKSISSKLKKALIVMLAFITMFIAMPIKSEASILRDFVNLLLYIPDGLMTIIDGKIGESREFTSRELDFAGWDKNGHIYNFKVTPYEIFTSGCYEDKGDGNYTVKLGYLDVNFFSDKPIVSETGGAVSSNILAPVIGNIYKALRNLCMILMLLVILYIGIKILISSVAEQQAKYKQFLMDWVVGFALLFMMHYIMAGIVGLNTLVVQMLSNEEGDSYYVGVNELQDGLADQNNTTSTWLDIVQGNYNLDDVSWGDTSFNYKWESEENFKRNRIITIWKESETATYSNPDSSKSGVGCVQEDGRLDLNDFANIVYDGQGKGGRIPHLHDMSSGTKKTDFWGDDGVIYLSASLINPEPFNEFKDLKKKDRAILKLNAMSYVRTISNFSSDEDAVILYQNNGIKELDAFDSMGYSALYLCLVIETIMFLFVYIKRVLQMAFLTMVAPIVAIMYPVDKLGDGKAQAFNQWFKDYLFNILIQPMHLLLYTVFIVAAGQLISRNIIYGLAVYGFMIPAENYFKKILGFEKASNSGGGPISKALGGGLAMGALGKFAGIGPAGRGHGGSKNDGKAIIHKTGKNKPTVGAPGASGGAGNGPGASGGNGGSGGGRQHTGRQRRGKGSGAGNPGGAGGAPGASGSVRRFLNNPRNALGRVGRIGTRKIARAISGGEYGSFDRPGFGRAAAKNISKFVGRKAAKYGGGILMGGAGLVTGAASAMATGNIGDIGKGVIVGASAGAKWSTGNFDNIAAFREDFNNDIRAEVANETDASGNLTQEAIDMRNTIRGEEVFKKLDSELSDLPEKDRKDYYEAINKYAQFVSIDSIKDVKGLVAIRGMKDESGNNLSEDKVVSVYEDAKGYDVRTHRDEYMKQQLRDLAKSFPGDNASKENIIRGFINNPKNMVNSPKVSDEWKRAYNEALNKAENVIQAQNKMS